MSRAPNETPEGYARKHELLDKERPLTYDELIELRELMLIATSHLQYNNLTIKETTNDKVN